MNHKDQNPPQKGASLSASLHRLGDKTASIFISSGLHHLVMKRINDIDNLLSVYANDLDNEASYRLVRDRLNCFKGRKYDLNLVAIVISQVIYHGVPMRRALKLNNIKYRQAFDQWLQKYEDNTLTKEQKIIIANEYDYIISRIVDWQEDILLLSKKYHCSKYAPKRYSKLLKLGKL